ncbi:MAG: sulfite exporter TauE/SafE family protein [candidate division Zixibacteria bacterium]|nr:sulfite exporter TauE/SafE family protein [candidate division Zixibacteria bacterium]
MESVYFAYFSALWLGILTSISPCPLATNIAAITYISKEVSEVKTVFINAMLYALGRTVTYLVVGVLIIAGIYSIPSVSLFLQRYMNILLGPILIIAGMLLLEMINIGNFGFGSDARKVAKGGGYWGSGFLGIIFALSFCPISAALFFGSLIPLAAKYNSSIIMPSAYGAGTGLPVILFAILLSFGVSAAGRIFDKLYQFEKWARKITGAIFILIGIYYILTYIFEIDISVI